MIISRVTADVPVPDAPVVVGEQEQLPPQPNLSRNLTVYLTGADGSAWDLTNGPVRLMPGVSGFFPSNVEHRWNTSPMLPGAVRAGYGLGVQPVRLPVFHAADSSVEWQELDRALWRALSPDAPCMVTVVSPDAETRALPVWFTGVGDGADLAQDPVAAMWATDGLEFVAEEPFWLGSTTVQTFGTETPQPYYSPPGSPHVKTLMSNSASDQSTLRNDGDVPAWPVYAVTGPVSSFTVGIGSYRIVYGALGAGSTVWIDTHPSRQTVGYERGGNDEGAWAGVTQRGFKEVPTGAEVPFTVTLVGPGPSTSARVELTPRYRRPW